METTLTQSPSKRTEIIVAIIVSISTFLAALASPICHHLLSNTSNSTNTNTDYYIISNSTSSIEEAKKLCLKNWRMGYIYSEVYLSSNGNYAVTLGKFDIDKAEAIRSKAIKKGEIRNDAFLLDKGFISKEYPEYENSQFFSINSLTSAEKLVYIIIYSTSNRNEAIRKARKYHSANSTYLVQKCDNGKYAVTTELIKFNTANELLRLNIANGLFRADSYLASEGFNDVVFDTNEILKRDFYIFTFSSKSRLNADKYSATLKNKLSGKYNLKVILTRSQNYCVVIGGFNNQNAEEVKNSLIYSGKIYSDSYVLRVDQ